MRIHRWSCKHVCALYMHLWKMLLMTWCIFIFCTFTLNCFLQKSNKGFKWWPALQINMPSLYPSVSFHNKKLLLHLYKCCSQEQISVVSIFIFKLTYFNGEGIWNTNESAMSDNTAAKASSIRCSVWVLHSCSVNMWHTLNDKTSFKVSTGFNERWNCRIWNKLLFWRLKTYNYTRY